nr:ATP-dependent DNA helicase RecG [Fodinicola acaciae]
MDKPLKSILKPAQARKLADGLGLLTVGDLIYHFPRRYGERGEATDLGDLKVNEDVSIIAKIVSKNVRQTRRKTDDKPLHIAEFTVGDGQRRLKVTFFNQRKRVHALQLGGWALFAGRVGKFKNAYQLTNADFKPIDVTDLADGEDPVEVFAAGLIPLYPATKEVTTWDISKAVDFVLKMLAPPEDPVPEAVRRRHGFMDLATALKEIHRPTTRDSLNEARKRLAYDEALALQVTLAQRRHAARDNPATPRPGRLGGLLDAFDERLPFRLTDGQLAVGKTLATELAEPFPMHRLLQGEVGSGKTVCALRAMLQVVDSGGQAALLAPTEVLAAQHARSLRKLLGPLATAGELGADDNATRVTLVTGSLSAPARRAAEAEAASGEAGIVVGTHALLSEGVTFADLGFVVIDEQHRFGVEQRDVLRAKSDKPPHVLVMTATPIPRTVAMTVYGDLETSSLSELPAGRAGITSHVVPADKPKWIERSWQKVRDEVAAGRQAYVVCPRIGEERGADDDVDEEFLDDDEGGEKQELQAVLEVAPALMRGELAGVRCGILHGRMPADEKESVMTSFAAGKVDVLIATTVIEVGVDVPNATVMVILDADRFGVSQLHQLRGRVGRGSAAGMCFLVTTIPYGTKTHTRLTDVASTLDGFELAELDLKARKEGDILGAAQSGRRSQLRLLSLQRDRKMILHAREDATQIVNEDPTLAKHTALAVAVDAFLNPDSADYLSKG